MKGKQAAEAALGAAAGEEEDEEEESGDGFHGNGVSGFRMQDAG